MILLRLHPMHVAPRILFSLIALSGGVTASSLAAESASVGKAGSATPAPRPPPLLSPEPNADRTVSFRVRAPSAGSVKMWGDWDGKGHDMAKDAEGVWSLTLGPLPAGLYSYSFNLDGLTIADPQNPRLKPMRSPTSSMLRVPGDFSVPLDDEAGVPRGTVHLHDYDSKALGLIRRLRVYTPPQYEASPAAKFPVLYLLHGSGDNEATWTEFGRAHVIVDHLIAAGKAQPMIVVMTDGHALRSAAPDLRSQNATDFELDLLGDVMPFVETRYRVLAQREARALAGLSMGGNQSLLIGLNHRELFAWVGGMSSAIREPLKPLTRFWADPASSAAPLRLLWIRVGRADFLLRENQRFAALLDEKKVPHDYAETEGAHSWPVWRKNLTELVPLLFQKER